MNAPSGVLVIAAGSVVLLLCLMALIRFAPRGTWLLRPLWLLLTLAAFSIAAYDIWRGNLADFAFSILFASIGASLLADHLTRRASAWIAFGFSSLFGVLSMLALFFKPDRDGIDLALAIFLTACLVLNLRTTFKKIAVRAASDQTPAATGTPA